MYHRSLFLHQTTACVAGRALRLYHELSDASGPPSQCPSQPAAAREVILHRDRLHARRRASVDNVFMAAAPSALGAISSSHARSACVSATALGRVEELLTVPESHFEPSAPTPRALAASASSLCSAPVRQVARCGRNSRRPRPSFAFKHGPGHLFEGGEARRAAVPPCAVSSCRQGRQWRPRHAQSVVILL